MEQIFARRVDLIFKSGSRNVYTHVTKLEVTHSNNKKINTPILFIDGEIDDVDGTRIKIRNQFPVSDLEITIVDWYVPF